MLKLRRMVYFSYLDLMKSATIIGNKDVSKGMEEPNYLSSVIHSYPTSVKTQSSDVAYDLDIISRV
jgi:hypothetical protein